jgi:replicative DNA helicase
MEIEAAADIVLMLHSEGPDSPRAGEVDVIVAKNRQGPLCTITMAMQGHYGRIVSMAPEDCPPDRDWTPSSVIGEPA